jgi:hypothetical protein
MLHVELVDTLELTIGLKEELKKSRIDMYIWIVMTVGANEI